MSFLLPPLGDAVPQRGNAFSRGLGRSILRLGRFRVEGTLPNLPQLVGIVVPHTSNWDFVFMMAFALASGLRVNWLGKHTLFRGPLGALWRWLGGFPVDRAAQNGVVEATTALFRQQSRCVLGLSPEGTRQAVTRWRTGFYYIAQAAGVPILLVVLDLQRRVIGFGPLVTPTGDVEADLEVMYAWYTDVLGYHPLQKR
jgi:1-acyl-sn-glycerol-3-phosphate acyltransferase